MAWSSLPKHLAYQKTIANPATGSSKDLDLILRMGGGPPPHALLDNVQGALPSKPVAGLDPHSPRIV